MLIFKNIRIILAILVAITIETICITDAFAQRGKGGGGARPSMGNMGGGGARPSMGGAGAKPSMGNMGGGARPNTPNMSRPNVPNMSRPKPSSPSLGNANARPSVPNFNVNSGGRPASGGSRPSLGGAGNLPNISRPTPLPSSATRPSIPNSPNRPSVKPPNIQMPSSRPSVGIGGNRPTLPGTGDRPSLGNITRPTTLPGIATRPGGGSDRPITLPGNIDRPTIGGNRPNVNLPVAGNNTVNRPSIGGNRPSIGKDTNINIGNSVNIGNNNGNQFSNRPNWDMDPGFSRPSWGLNAGGNNWNSNWHNNSINHHHHWYNGCWQGYWGSNWYAPVAWGGIGWGLGALTNGWGNNNAVYYNPYYAEPMVAQSMPYDYSQPVVINNYASMTSEVGGSETQIDPSTPLQSQALSSFDQGLLKFQEAQYGAALSDFNTSLKQLPGDAVVHEVRSLALFATGDYKAAAAGLNSLLSAAPGMDWTTMSGLYGNPEDYTNQFRNLEQFCKSNPADAPAHFVLAYHYLVTGSKDAAVSALKVVVQNQPKDVTAKRMLDAMSPPDEPVAESAAQPPTPALAPAPATQPSTDAPETDLVGFWTAQPPGANIELSISEDSTFTWKVDAKNQQPVALTGQLVVESDGISLETKEQGSIGGTVHSKGPDNWKLIISGAPASDPGLSFARVK